MSLPRYPEYKDSGVRWLGEVPAHWDLMRLRRCVRLNPSKSEVVAMPRDLEVSFLPMEAVGDDGSLSLGRERPIQEVETGYTYFRDGDVAFAKITPCFENGKGALMAGLSHGIGFGTTELTVARPIPGLMSSAFLHWIFRSPNFRSEGEASMYGAGGQKRVPDDFVRELFWAVPPESECERIATFLDHEAAKIDALIVEQEKLLALLAEKRQATISHAVTRGLTNLPGADLNAAFGGGPKGEGKDSPSHPNAPMKDSGIPWLGEVPAHWVVHRLGALYRETAEVGSDDLPILSVSIHDGVSDKELDDSELDRKVTRSDDRSKYKRVLPNDLTYNMMRAWQGGFGTVAVVGQVSPAYVVATPRRDIRTSFVEQLLRTPQAIEQVRRYSRGITEFRLRLYWEEFKNLQIAIPPLPEQDDILSKTVLMTEQFDALAEETRHAVGLLKERRSALISAAVTGKIDVRETA